MLRLEKEGQEALQAGQLERAQQIFKKYSKLDPRNAEAEYCLGVTSLDTNKLDEAKRALVNVVVMTSSIDVRHICAMQKLSDRFKLSPMCCLRHGLVRWDRSIMPLKIYIARGLLPPSSFTNRSIETFEIHELGETIRRQARAKELPRSGLFDDSYVQCVRDGISSWKWAADESVVSFEFVDDVDSADLLIFWGDTLHGYAGSTYLPIKDGARTDPAIILLSLDQKHTMDENLFRKSLTVTAAHEFGHALGLEHSIEQNLLMSPCGSGVSKQLAKIEFSESEKETLRALYALPPDILLHGVGR